MPDSENPNPPPDAPASSFPSLETDPYVVELHGILDRATDDGYHIVALVQRTSDKVGGAKIATCDGEINISAFAANAGAAIKAIGERYGEKCDGVNGAALIQAFAHGLGVTMTVHDDRHLTSPNVAASGFPAMQVANG